jgi:hypothetical protein
MTDPYTIRIFVPGVACFADATNVYGTSDLCFVLRQAIKTAGKMGSIVE